MAGLAQAFALALVLTVSDLGCGSGGGGASEHSLRAWATGIASGTGMSGGIVLRSEDGGTTWALVLGPVDRGLLSGVAFVDRLMGWVVGGGAIFQTTDGGGSWVTQGTTDGNLRAVAFLSRSRGVAVGQAVPTHGTFGPRLVLFTDDGGAHWSPAPIADGTRLEPARVGLSSVCFTNDGIGLTAGNGPLENAVYLSRDQGATWSDITDRLPPGGYTATACAGGRDLWLAYEWVLHSADGGASWETIATDLGGLAQVPSDLVFVDATLGWAVGSMDHDNPDKPIVVHTQDGGYTWRAQPLPPTGGGRLLAVAFTSADTGVAVGSTPFFPPNPFLPIGFTTTNGGKQWHSVTLPAEIKEAQLVDVAVISSKEP